MDQLMCASLSHIHYWYEVGMLKEWLGEGYRDIKCNSMVHNDTERGPKKGHANTLAMYC